MRTRIRKWGNSLGGRIPSALAEDAHLHEGAEVDVTTKAKGYPFEVVLPADCPVQGVAFADQVKLSGLARSACPARGGAAGGRRGAGSAAHASPARMSSGERRDAALLPTHPSVRREVRKNSSER